MPTHYPHNAPRPDDAPRPVLRRRAPGHWLATAFGAMLVLYGLCTGALVSVALGVVVVVVARSVAAPPHYLWWSAVICLAVLSAVL